MKRHILITIAFALSAIMAAAQWPQSRIVTDTIHSDMLGADRPYTVYLPVGFDADSARTYPVLYLLHGMYGNNTSWEKDMRLRDVADQMIYSDEIDPMVIVTPHAGGADPMVEQNGYFNMKDWPYEDFFFEEFMPYIEKTYRCGGSKNNRAVAGLSMGGGGATSYAQRHPQIFGSAYAMSALMDIPEERAVPSQTADDKVARLTRSVKELSCVRYVAEADEARRDALRSVRWFVDCGDDDFLLDRNIELVQAMHKANIPVQFRVRDGGHTVEYWHTALFTCLPFVSRNFAR